MQTKKTVAIIGATGKMGSAIAKSLLKGNYQLLLSAKDPGKVNTLLEEIKNLNPNANAEVIDAVENAGWEADIIILAVPYAAEEELAKELKNVAVNKIIISIANPLNASYDGLVTSSDTSAGEELQKLLPASKVIKAFNTVFAAAFTTPVIDGKKADAFIAGNDEEALEIASELVRTAGLNPIIAGALHVSGTLEKMQLLLIQLAMKNNYNWLAGWKVLHN